MEAGVAVDRVATRAVAARQATGRGPQHLQDGEVFLLGAHIPEYTEGTWNNHTPRRPRKLLLHKKEIASLIGTTRESGLALVPLEHVGMICRKRWHPGGCEHPSGGQEEHRFWWSQAPHSLGGMTADAHDARDRLDRFELIPDHIELRLIDGNITKRPVSHFMDIVVNGHSLIGLLAGGGNYVTNLNRAWVPEVVPAQVAVLLGRQPDPDLSPGRVPLLVCAVDGDVACGAVTAALSVGPETVTWTGLRWEDGWEDGYQEPNDVRELPESMTFDRRQYEQELEQAVVRVSELPHDEAEHTYRRFLWPWQWGWRLPRD